MTRPNLPTSRWPHFPPSRAFCGAALVAGVVVLCVRRPDRPGAPPRVSVAARSGYRAFIEGRYDEVDALSEKLDARDPSVVALKARAAIARGRYADAESVLRPVAMRAPASEAALELGLLEQMLGRAEAATTLERVAVPGDRTAQADGLARSARALRALGRFQEANGAYRAAAAAAPGDASINTAWGELFLEKYNKPEALKSFQAALERDPRWAPALLGSARTLSDDNPPQAIAAANRLVEQPSRRGAGLSREPGGRRRSSRRSASVARKGTRREPVEPRSALVAGGAQLCGRQQKDSRPKSPRRSPSPPLRRGTGGRRAARATTASTKPSTWRGAR
jgi:tetratricopeptide (TPR) repeat protein